MPNSINNKRIARNTILLYFRMLLTMAVSLYTSRIILNTLGIEDFGIYNVVGGIVLLFAFLNGAMSSSTQRFLTFEIGKGDMHQLKRIFSMSISIHIIIAFFIIVLSETVGLWFLNNKLSIPPERLDAANWVYQFSIFAFIITVLNVPYFAAIIAHEHMKMYAYISILEVLLKLLIVFMLIWFGFDKLIFYAVLVFVVTLLIRIIYTIYCNLKFNECRVHFFWDKKLFQEMSRFANWNLIGAFAGIAYNQGLNILLNIFFGPAINAARAIAYQVQGAVNGFVTNFQVAVNPQITKSYAIGDKLYMYSLVFNAAKYSFYLLLLLSLPVLIETEFILKLWLKTVPDYAIIFTRLILLDVLICSLSGSLQTMVQATGKIKFYQIVVSGILLMNLPISYFLLRSGFMPQSTFVVSIIISSIALIARLFVLRIIDNFPVRNFFNKVIFKVVFVVVIATIIPYYISTQISSPEIQFVTVFILSILSVIISVYFLGLTISERRYFNNFLLKYLSKIIK